MKIRIFFFILANLFCLMLTAYLLLKYKEDLIIGIGFAMCAFTGLWSMVTWKSHKEKWTCFSKCQSI